MSKKKRYFSIGIFLGALGLCTWLVFWMVTFRETTTITFLNVGEGDAILIMQGSNQILIDGGRSGKELLARIGRHVPFWDRTLETVIATHPDADHIGGFPALFAAYRVKQFLYTGAENDTETSLLVQRALEIYHIQTQVIFRGGSIRFPYGGELTVEYPFTPLPKETKDTNSGSIVTRFLYGGTQFLFTGDLPHEESVLPDPQTADILKVAHHGSKYSTSAEFLDRLHPREAVISVGKNSYGHPSPDVIGRLTERGIIVRRTDTEGDIQYLCIQERGRCDVKEP